MTHLELRGRWQQVLITDNPFKQVRVSPYAFAARIAHDVPEVHPTVVCSTRDRNILALESEVRHAGRCSTSDHFGGLTDRVLVPHGR
jgi:hypothetical protein